MLENDKYIILGKTPCSGCEQAKDVLNSIGEQFLYIDITKPEHLEHLMFVKQTLQRTTVPQIRTPDGQWIGGIDELRKHLR